MKAGIGKEDQLSGNSSKYALDEVHNRKKRSCKSIEVSSVNVFCLVAFLS